MEKNHEEIGKLLLNSVILEGVALAKIIEVEKDKLVDYINQNELKSTKDIIEINESIENVLKEANLVETTLSNKLNNISKIYNTENNIEIHKMYKECVDNRNENNLQINNNPMCNKFNNYNKLSSIINKMIKNSGV
ncbi:MAG: hypothetical protein RR751_01575 [Clostridia bacterium]